MLKTLSKLGIEENFFLPDNSLRDFHRTVSRIHPGSGIGPGPISQTKKTQYDSQGIAKLQNS